MFVWIRKEIKIKDKKKKKERKKRKDEGGECARG